MKRFLCRLFGHGPWLMVWRAGARDRGASFVVCTRCGAEGWRL